ncbi:MAG TPA: methyltransferase domain-containing protein [Terracidiphilus sp.]|nr:methyltransferase domain-containing protein [Terracidiphilus sp.]
MPAQSHRSDPRILGWRTLEKDHRCLAELLRPGFSVLDVGCGTGAITAGIARAVKPEGHVVGVDRDEGLLEIARTEHAEIKNLQFNCGDATALKFRAQFDIVTSARVLQWIAEPRLAIENMRQAAKGGGVVVVLDYNHTQNQWEPEPPPEFRVCYDAFLAWRRANGWDNEMADHLPELFRSAGLASISSCAQDEVVKRGEPEFAWQSYLWTGTLQHVAEQLVAAGFCTEAQLQIAREVYDPWVRTELVQQTLAMRATIGVVP